jgi:FlaA1/EpsC-like NDP-sugar epimerase
MFNKLADHLLALPRAAKRMLALAVDTTVCVMCVWLAFGLRLEDWHTFDSPEKIIAAVFAVGIALPMFVVTGFYRAIFRFSGTAALIALVKACAAFGLVYGMLFTVYTIEGVPRSVGVNVPLLLFVLTGASRLAARYWLGGLYIGILNRQALPQVVIYGAGSAGRQLAAALATSREMVVRAFVDDSEQLQGASLNGLVIYPPARLVELVQERGVSDLLLALPSISSARRAEIVRDIQALKLPLHVRTLPDLMDMAQGRLQVQDLHELDIEDLLGRPPVPPNEELLHQNIRGKVVLVTGAGGSIGSELCRQIVRLGPATLLLVELSEYSLYSIHHELQRKLGAAPVRVLPLLASVRDEARMREIMRTWRPDTVYHAAAYKHVPLVEHNPAEGVRNNVIGTWVTARLAAEWDVSDFVLVSTDKAVRPTNVMGASKRLAEMVLQGLSQDKASRTRFSMVRFGNVLGSSGSVVPLFRQQIRDGGPITLTHADITRFFMTIPEAAQLVIQAGAMATGGDVFVLDMGSPVRIIDLARRMVELSGLAVRDERNPDGDIEISITGLRPGEKLYEELLIGDNPSPTQHPRIMKAHDDALPWSRLTERLKALERALAANNVDLLRRILAELVSGYRPAPEIVDWIHLEQVEEDAAKDEVPAVAAA